MRDRSLKTFEISLIFQMFFIYLRYDERRIYREVIGDSRREIHFFMVY